MKQSFTAPIRLPGYNQLKGRHWAIGHRIKREAMEAVEWAARAARVQPVTGKVVVTITCYEPNRRRDVDNVKSGANKVVLDALKNMGIIQNDGPKYVQDATATVEYDKPARVVVEIEGGGQDG